MTRDTYGTVQQHDTISNTHTHTDSRNDGLSLDIKEFLKLQLPQWGSQGSALLSSPLSPSSFPPPLPRAPKLSRLRQSRASETEPGEHRQLWSGSSSSPTKINQHPNCCSSSSSCSTGSCCSSWFYARTPNIRTEKVRRSRGAASLPNIVMMEMF